MTLASALARIEAHSPFLRKLAAKYPDVAAAPLDFLVTEIDSDLPVAAALRIAKGRLALAVALGDLAGLLTLEQVTGALSDFADRAVDLAIADAIRQHVPDAEPQGLAAIALGKQGGRELNYSSDLDPILIFDPDTLPVRPREEPAEAAVRIGRRIVETMQARDEHGYVFRIDLRLRPSPEVTPIVLPAEAAISYYESQALPWERAAFIRARACAGDLALGQGFLDAIRPFVWRRGLDFGAVEDVRSISRRIRGHHSRGQAFGPGYDLKRGRGGIRECEFFAQIHQLIHGGREPGLRSPATLEALAALNAAGRIDPETADTLARAYRLYRTIEHRLQMIEDRQTHSLPEDAAALDGVAKLHGLEGGPALLALLAPHVAAVGTIYDALDGPEAATLPEGEPLEAALAKAGFPEPDAAAQRIAHWRSGAVRAVRSPAARTALEAVLPQLVEALGAAPDPQRAITRLSTLIEKLPSAINLFRLLDAQPRLLNLLTAILAYAPTLADALARTPELLDRLIDASAFDPVGAVATLVAEMSIEGDLERRLDHVRRTVGDYRFALGVQIVEGPGDPLDVAAGYARLAEAAIITVTDAVIADFAVNHGIVRGCTFAILALGRMGGAELSHSSDLDLIYLFTGPFDNESNAARPTGAVQYFNRLAQRISAGLSVPTAAGPLYEIDTRLRPSGAQGPLVVSTEGFAKYQREDAWTWEHMALTRARVVYGTRKARDEIDGIIADVLATPRDRATLIADAVKMRGDMLRHKPPKSDLDVKLIEGGLVDLEFAVHVTQLAHCTGFEPHLGRAIADLVAQGLLPDSFVEAHALMTRLLVVTRLVAPDLAEPDEAGRALIARACGAADWEALLDRLGALRQEVSAAWARVSRED